MPYFMHPCQTEVYRSSPILLAIQGDELLLLCCGW